MIPFVDFRARVAALRPEIEAAIARVLDSGWFILGPEGEALEAELATAFGVEDAVGVGNGTEAIQLALEGLGVGAGDEVITSPLSAAFTPLAILRAGATPVFADVDEQTLNLSPEAAAAAVTPHTKVILPVHLYGHPADLHPLRELARDRGLLLLEDACQAHGALYRGKPAGSVATAAALSFYPTKNLGALGDGGAVLTSDPELAANVRRLRNGGQVDRYRHAVVGVNSRLDEIQAAILRVSLRHLDAWTSRRRELARLYLRELEGSGVRLPLEQPYAQASYHLFVVRHSRRKALADSLASCGIATLVHYPIPLHLQQAFSSLGGKLGEFPVAEAAADEILSLPLYPEMTDEQARAVAQAVRQHA